MRRRLWMYAAAVSTGLLVYNILYDPINGATMLGMGALGIAIYKARTA